ncbi:MAG: flagellar hook capping FlgD N-terminal domain-containing protein [Candidatus Sericytochromatia bacterium]
MDFAIQSLLPKASGSAKAGNVVDDPVQLAEDFAKLLVAQIQNQDPEAPLDATQIITQNAQFTASLATVRLANQMAHYQQVASTLGVIGKPAEYIDPNDFTETPQVGVVSGADYSTDPPGLIIDGRSIPMENIIRVDSQDGSTGGTSQASLNKLELLGKNVEYFDANNANVVGLVDEVDMIQDLVTVNGTSVPISSLIRVIN